MSLRDLLEARSRTVDEMRAIADKPEGDGGDLSDAQASRFDELKQQLERQERAVERQQVVDEAQRRLAAPAIVHGRGDGQYEQRAREFSLVKMMLARLGENVDIGFEKEISSEVRHRRPERGFAGIAVPDQYFETRVINVTPQGSPTSLGASLYPTVSRPNMFIDRLRSALVVQRLGATVLDGLVGTVDIPRQVTSSVAQHVIEDGALSRTDPRFDDVTLTPKTVGAMTSYTRRTLLNALPAIENIVRSDLAAVIARAIDFQALMGPGTGALPRGVRFTTGVNDMNLGPPTWAKVVAIPAEIQSDDADLGSLAWAMDPKAVAKLRTTIKVASTDSVHLMENPNELAGYPVVTSTAIQAAGSPTVRPVFFAAWSQLLLGFWSGLDVLVNPFSEDDYVRGRVSVRVMRDYDVQVRHPESFAFAEDLPI